MVTPSRKLARMSHILLATLGTTPQVLTEAFYYYHRHLGITFDEVHVLTTVPGARVLKSAVLGPRGAFVRLCRDLDVPRPRVKFGPATIHVFTGAGGAPIDDVRTTADGEALAGQMLDIVRRICTDTDATVHAIASGGRKVMSLYLQAMMQIAGRPHDKLFHLLVHPAIERQIVDKRNRLDYFYPRGAVRIDGRLIREEEQLACIEVPLLTISPSQSLRRDLPWGEIVRLRKREAAWGVAPPPLTIDPRTRQLRIDDTAVSLAPRMFFWYYALARLVLDNRGRLPARELGVALEIDARGAVRVRADAEDASRWEDLTACLRRYHRELFPSGGDDFSDVLRRDLHPKPSGLSEQLSKTNNRLRKALGGASRPYEVLGRRGSGEHGLGLPPDAIRILRPKTAAVDPVAE